MTLREAFSKYETPMDLTEEDIVEQGSEYIIVVDGPVINLPLPDKSIGMMHMTWCNYDPDSDDYLADWDGTALFVDGEYYMSEQDGVDIGFYNNFGRFLNSNYANLQAMMFESYANYQEYIEATKEEEASY